LEILIKLCQSGVWFLCVAHAALGWRGTCLAGFTRLTAESISGHTRTKRIIVFEFLSNKDDTYQTLPCPRIAWRNQWRSFCNKRKDLGLLTAESTKDCRRALFYSVAGTT